MCVMKECPICFGSTILCSKCEIISLKLEIEQLKAKYAKYDEERLNALKLPPYAEYEIKLRIKQSKTPIVTDFTDITPQIQQLMFTTVTFDPLKFGIQSYEEQRKNYILHHFKHLVDKTDIIEYFYGSFEYHSSGIIHAHMVVKTQYSSKFIDTSLRHLFTDNTRNKRAVITYPFKKTAIEYINKESTHYFEYPNLTRKQPSPQNKASTTFLSQEPYDPHALDYIMEPCAETTKQFGAVTATSNS